MRPTKRYKPGPNTFVVLVREQGEHFGRRTIKQYWRAADYPRNLIGEARTRIGALKNLIGMEEHERAKEGH
jgi:hypothetical protein